MRLQSCRALIVGNAALDILCFPINDVPRHGSITFEKYDIFPGGCGSNTAIGLAKSGIMTTLIAYTGSDYAGMLALETWNSAGIDTDYVQTTKEQPTGLTIGLVDDDAQPRFVYQPGANTLMKTETIRSLDIRAENFSVFHVAGYFLLPGLIDENFSGVLEEFHTAGVFTSLDVALSPMMAAPRNLWLCLPHLDVFFCNLAEAEVLTGKSSPNQAALELRARGARAVIIKMGAHGSWLECDDYSKTIPPEPAMVVDTTGAGDAYCAAFISSICKGNDYSTACGQASKAGAKIISKFGAVSAWF